MISNPTSSSALLPTVAGHQRAICTLNPTHKPSRPFGGSSRGGGRPVPFGLLWGGLERWVCTRGNGRGKSRDSGRVGGEGTSKDQKLIRRINFLEKALSDSERHARRPALTLWACSGKTRHWRVFWSFADRALQSARQAVTLHSLAYFLTPGGAPRRPLRQGSIGADCSVTGWLWGQSGSKC